VRSLLMRAASVFRCRFRRNLGRSVLQYAASTPLDMPTITPWFGNQHRTRSVCSAGSPALTVSARERGGLVGCLSGLGRPHSSRTAATVAT
jgi:hypothetical protein